MRQRIEKWRLTLLEHCGIWPEAFLQLCDYWFPAISSWNNLFCSRFVCMSLFKNRFQYICAYFENNQKRWQIYDVDVDFAAPAATAALFRAVTVSLLALSLLLLQLRLCWCERLLLMGSLLDWLLQLTNTQTFVHAYTYVHTRIKATHTRCLCFSRRLGVYVSMCAAYLMNQQQKMGATFSVFAPFVDVGFFGRSPCTHTCKFQRTHTLTPAALSIFTFAIFTF